MIDNEQTSLFLQEKEQCKLLLELIDNFDFGNIVERSLRILELYPENNLAKMFYRMNFNVESLAQGDFLAIDFSTSPIEQYINNNKGQVDIELSLKLIFLISQKYLIDERDCACVCEIIENVEALNLNDDQLKAFYETVFEIGQDGNLLLKKAKNLNRKSRLGGLKTFILTDNEYIAAYAKEYHTDIKRIVKTLQNSNKKFKNAINDYCQKSEVSKTINKETFEKQEKDKKKKTIIILPVILILVIMAIIGNLV